MGRIFGQGFNIGFQIRQAFANFLQCITFNSTTSEFEDTKGNMQPVLNQVPVFTAEGDDVIDLGNIQFGTSDFNLKLYVYIPNDANLYNLISSGSNSNNYIRLTTLLTYGVALTIKTSGVSTNYYNSNITFGAWNVIELDFDRDVGCKIIVNGISENTLTPNIDDLTFSNNLFLFKNPVIAGNVFQGKCVYVAINDTFINTQNFSGNKVYSTDGSITGTITGSGSWWTTEDDIPDYNQQGCKIVEHAGGTAYVPLAISDATINSDYTSVTSITEATQDGTTLINDGALLDLHPTVSDLYVGGDLGYGVFDGASDLSHDSLVSCNQVSFWFKTSSSARMSIVGVGGMGTIIISNGRLLAGGVSTNNATDIATLADGAWHYAVVSGNDSEGYTFIIDGVDRSGGNSGDWRVSVSTLIGCAFTTVKSLFFTGQLSNINLNNQAIYPLKGDAIDTVSGLPATNNGVTFYPTLSDNFTEIETASGIDHHAVQGGDPISIAYANTTYVAGVKTNIGCLIPYNRYVSGDELTYAMDDTLTYYGIDEYKDFAIE